MLGKYYIKVSIGNRVYEFDVKRKITKITGDSAIGKSTLYSDIVDNSLRHISVERYKDNKIEPTSVKLVTVDNSNYEIIFNSSNNIILIDEFILNLRDNNIIDAIKYSDNYFILITREALGQVSYSVDEIYTLSMKTFNRVQHTYTLVPLNTLSINKSAMSEKDILLLTEDSGAGNKFFREVFKEFIVKSSNGKDNILSKLLDILSVYPYYNIFVIADGAAFGSVIQSLTSIFENYPNVHFILPESFEYVLLQSIYTRVPETLENAYIPCMDIIERTYDVYDTCNTIKGEYMHYDDGSWEVYFKQILSDYTNHTKFSYGKSNIPAVYYNYVDIILKNFGLSKRLDLSTDTHFFL